MISKELLPSFDAKVAKYGKRKFTKYEDNRLAELIANYGTKSWSIIASEMPGRSARQCRERYMNYLQPNLTNGPWTDKDDALLILKYAELGPKWSQISRSFENRSEVNIKNHWASMERRKSALLPNVSTISPNQANQSPEIDLKKMIKAEPIFEEIDWRFPSDSIFRETDQQTVSVTSSAM